MTWKAPADRGNTITGYVLTPYHNGAAGKAVSVDASTTSRKLSGLPNGGTLTFVVAAKNAAGTGPASLRSRAAKPLALPAAPVIVAVTADATSALLSWNPGSDGGSPITGYQVTPYVGNRAQTDQVFGPGSTTNTVTGLTAGVTYQFTVAARTAAGVGPASARSDLVTPNESPTLLFAAPRPASVDVAYFADLAITRGRPPFIWSVPSGTLPPGILLDPISGILTGIPTAAGSATVVIRVVDSLARTGTRRVTLVVNKAPSLNFPPPPLGEVKAVYAHQLVVIGGTGPFTWALASGVLPPGITLNPTTGLLSGKPTVSGSFGSVIQVTDANGLTATEAVRIPIQEASIVTLSASTNAANFGTKVTFTVDIGPGSAAGTVTLVDQLPDGADLPLGTFPVTLNRASFTLDLPSFNSNSFRAQYDATITNAVAFSNIVRVEVSALPGQLVIDQFRQSGAGGATDQYVALRNNTAIQMNLVGIRVEAPGGIVIILPSSVRPIQPGASYLVAASGYRLPGIGPDLVVPSLGRGGLRIIAPDEAGTVTDAAGSTAGFSTGTPLPAFTAAPMVPHAWIRLRAAGKAIDTFDNLADFRLVSTVRGPIGGLPSALGSPSPQNSLGAYPRNSAMQSTLLDPDVAVNAAPNRQFTPGVGGAGGTLVIRRIITNRSDAPITQARLRVTSLSQLNGAPLPGSTPPPVHANLRLINPATPTTTIPLSGDGTVLVQNLSMDAPATDPPGGGLGTTLTLPFLLGGLAPGASMGVAITFAVDTPGSFWFSYDVDALGGGATPTVAGSTKAAQTNRHRFAMSQQLTKIVDTIG